MPGTNSALIAAFVGIFTLVIMFAAMGPIMDSILVQASANPQLNGTITTTIIPMMKNTMVVVEVIVLPAMIAGIILMFYRGRGVTADEVTSMRPTTEEEQAMLAARRQAEREQLVNRVVREIEAREARETPAREVTQAHEEPKAEKKDDPKRDRYEAIKV
jgi:uncharacterized membrane protein (DUF106 family)